VGIDLSREAAPDATTLLKFRRLLERHGLTPRIFETINATLAERGLLLEEGTLVDATIIAAPSSTKNREGKRDPEMHQTGKGKQWHFGMKAHIGVDADSGLVHTVAATSTEFSDVTQADRLLHGEEWDALGRVRERLEQAKVEHPFQVIKQRFGHRKVRYRGLAKYQAQLYTLFGLANLILARRRLLDTCV
jgi:IS5 family transposase